MEILKTLIFFLSLYFGHKVFNAGQVIKIKWYWFINFSIYIGVFLLVFNDKSLFFLIDLFYVFPLTTGVLCFSFSFFLVEKKKLENLNKILVFYELLAVNLRFGRSLYSSIESSIYILGMKNKKKENVCKNVVMQQLRSSSSLYFPQLGQELEKLYKLKVGLMDLVLFNQETIKYEYFFLQKKSAALTQYYIQVFIVGALWLICITYLFLTQQIVQNYKLVLASLCLILIGLKLSMHLFKRSGI